MRPALVPILLPSYDVDAKALFARMTTAPTSTRKRLISNLIRALKVAGVYDKLDVLYVLAAHDGQAARLNWKADAYNLTAVNSPTFTADRGYAGDGATTNLTTGWIPSSNGVNFVQDSASFGIWSRTARAAASAAQLGGNGAAGGKVNLFTRFSGDLAFARVNENPEGGSVSNASSDGFISADRAAAGARKTYRNGSSLGSTSQSSTTVPTVEMYLSSVNNNGTPATRSTDQLAAAFFGGSLGDAGHSAFYTALNTYMTAVGAA